MVGRRSIPSRSDAAGLGSLFVAFTAGAAVAGALAWVFLRRPASSSSAAAPTSAPPRAADAHAASTPAHPAAAASTTRTKVFSDPEMPVDAAGRTYHLGVAPGDVSPRILSVGDAGRAARIAAACLAPGSVAVTPSSRGFTTHTGLYAGARVSIIATGMGTPMMDFVVREARAVLPGQRVAVVRFGTCGGLNDTAPGSVVVADASVLVRRDPDAVGDALEGAAGGDAAGAGAGAAGAAGASAGVGGVGGAAPASLAPTPASPYAISRRVFPDARLTAALAAALRARLAELAAAAGAPAPAPVVAGLDVTADSFYASQGRRGRAFADANAGLLERVEAAHPTARSCQMETFHLLDLARAAAAGEPLAAAAAAVVLVNRRSAATVAKEDLAALELAGGRAALDALVAFEM